MQIKILITGVNGLLGTELANKFSCDASLDVVGVDKDIFDITDRELTINFIDDVNPDYIIHTAGYTNVDKAEEEKDLCSKVNVAGTQNISLAAKKVGAVLCYFSTDFVFDGKKEGAYIEEDIPNPINFYGKTKLEGEDVVCNTLHKFFIIRISWLYGKYGKSFVNTIDEEAQKNNILSIVDDQIGSPTYSKDIADNLLDVITKDQYGIYNMPGTGFCSWYEFACEIVKNLKLDVKVVPISSDKLDRLAKRPKNSRLSCDKVNNLLGRVVMPEWRKSLVEFLRSEAYKGRDIPRTK